MQKLLRLLRGGRPNKRARIVGQLKTNSNQYNTKIHFCDETVEEIIIQLTGRRAIGPVVRNLCHATTFSVGWKIKNAWKIKYSEEFDNF